MSYIPPGEKAALVALLRKYGDVKIKIPIPFVRWTIKFSVLADQIERYA